MWIKILTAELMSLLMGSGGWREQILAEWYGKKQQEKPAGSLDGMKNKIREL